MKRAVIAGATGLTGNALVQLLCQNSNYESIIELGRRKSSAVSDKLTFVKTDFTDLGQLPIDIPVDEVYCCLGTTIKKAGSQEAFRKVDFEAVVELSKWARQFPTCRFVVISSIGASPQSSNFYLRTKGQMESALKRLNLHSLIIFRPSVLDGERREVRFAEKLSLSIMRFLRPLFVGSLKRYAPVNVKLLAAVMVEYAQSKFGDTYIVESDEIQKFNKKA